MTPIHKAVIALHRGEVIAHPTETVFGLAVDPTNQQAIQRLRLLKARPASKGFILLIADRTQIAQVAAAPSALACQLMDCFWPGPLTLVLPARPGLLHGSTGQSDWVAVRHSSSPLVADLLAAWGKPLASTSANYAGHPEIHDSATARNLWKDRLAVILDGQCNPASPPSTLLKITADHVRLLRPGALSVAAIRTEIPDLDLRDADGTPLRW